MSTKKFMNRTAFVLASFSIACFGYCLYETKVNTYKLEAAIVQLDHIKNHIQATIKNNLEHNRTSVGEAKVEGK